jgi:hypothetical protein
MDRTRAWRSRRGLAGGAAERNPTGAAERAAMRAGVQVNRCRTLDPRTSLRLRPSIRAEKRLGSGSSQGPKFRRSQAKSRDRVPPPPDPKPENQQQQGLWACGQTRLRVCPRPVGSGLPLSTGRHVHSPPTHPYVPLAYRLPNSEGPDSGSCEAAGGRKNRAVDSGHRSDRARCARSGPPTACSRLTPPCRVKDMGDDRTVTHVSNPDRVGILTAMRRTWYS